MKKEIKIGIIVLVILVAVIFIFWKIKEQEVGDAIPIIINYEDMPEEWFYCEQDEDCDLIDRDCGDCCHFLYLNKEYVEEFKILKKEFCSNLDMVAMCDIECKMMSPKCIDNKCGF